MLTFLSAHTVKAADVSPPALDKLNVCRTSGVLSGLLYIAEDKGFFADEGLAPSFTAATNAKPCQDALIAGQADVFTECEGVLAPIGNLDPPTRIIAELGTQAIMSAVARRDRGIATADDLRGKRIGYLPGTLSYYYTMAQLKQVGLTPADVKLTALQPQAMAKAIDSGAVDAVFIWEPWSTQALTGLGDNGIRFKDPSLYTCHELLTASQTSMAQKPVQLQKLLRAMIKAESFIATHKDESIALLARDIPFDAEVLKQLWDQYTNHVHLDDSVADLLTSDFTTLKQNDENFVDAKMPDFHSLIDLSVLRAVDPQRVQ